MTETQRRIAGLTCAQILLLGGSVVVLLFCCLLPGGHFPEASRRTQCRDNLHVIGLALHNYHDVYASFPAGYNTDDRGSPIHSWRVHALPYLDDAPLYNSYTFAEPWNGPANAALAQSTEPPREYQCPSETAERVSEESWTSYVAVLGPHTNWPDEQPVRIEEITDGTSNTLLVVESHNTGIHWMEPRDLHVTQMSTTVNPAFGQGVSSAHEGGVYAVFADGATRFVSENIDAELLRRLVERDDGEEVGDF